MSTIVNSVKTDGAELEKTSLLQMMGIIFQGYTLMSASMKLEIIFIFHVLTLSNSFDVRSDATEKLRRFPREDVENAYVLRPFTRKWKPVDKSEFCSS
jgi:hypothetical protein